MTGWSVNYADQYQPVYRPNRHDAKDKQFSAFYGNKKLTGKSTATGGAEEINEMLDMIFQNNETALFIVRKLFTFLDIMRSLLRPKVISSFPWQRYLEVQGMNSSRCLRHFS